MRGILECTFVLSLGVSLLGPVLPVFRETFGLTETEASLLFAIYFLPAVVLSPAIGRLAPTEYLAGALSIRTSTGFLGRGAGPVLFTASGRHLGYEPALLATGLAALLLGGYGMTVTDAEPMTAPESVRR